MPDISAQEMEEAYVQFVGDLIVYARRRLTVPDHAEDIVHDVICDTWMDRERLTVRTWKGLLFGAVKIRILNDLRWQRRERDLELTEDLPAAEAPAKDYDANARARLLAWAVGGLTPMQKRVVLDRLDHGHGDAALVAGCSSRFAEAMLFTRAKTSLRTKLSCLIS
jgi:DNA-directed RNA polymerase specialized sigma24 family protein